MVWTSTEEINYDGSNFIQIGYIGRSPLRMELPGKRKLGRPTRRFMDVVKEDMAEVEVTEEHTEARNNWRRKIRCGDPCWEKPKEEEEEEAEEEAFTNGFSPVQS